MTTTFNHEDIELMTEALHRLREIKVRARATVIKAPGHEHFTPMDFGVPAIDKLLNKLDAGAEELDGMGICPKGRP